MKQIEHEKTQGYILRSKAKWYEEGEKSTKYFLNLEKSNALKKHIRKLKLDNNEIVTDQKVILEEQRKF